MGLWETGRQPAPRAARRASRRHLLLCSPSRGSGFRGCLSRRHLPRGGPRPAAAGLRGSARLLRLSSNRSNYELGSCETPAPLAPALDLGALDLGAPDLGARSSENLRGVSRRRVAALLLGGSPGRGGT